MNYLLHLRRLLASEIEVWIARALPSVVRRTLARGLRGVWRRGDWDGFPDTGVVVALNHHAWWDVYLVYLVASRLGRRWGAIMAAPQLERFPFFRRFGVLSERELRTALRRLDRGDLLFVFPEGELRPVGGVERLRPGVAWLAARAGVPVVPLALRVLLRGAQHPEAYLSLGAPLAPGAELTQSLERSLNALLVDLDRTLVAADPERPPAGFEVWMSGARSSDERADGAAVWWRR